MALMERLMIETGGENIGTVVAEQLDSQSQSYT